MKKSKDEGAVSELLIVEGVSVHFYLREALLFVSIVKYCYMLLHE